MHKPKYVLAIEALIFGTNKKTKNHLNKKVDLSLAQNLRLFHMQFRREIHSPSKQQ